MTNQPEFKKKIKKKIHISPEEGPWFLAPEKALQPSVSELLQPDLQGGELRRRSQRCKNADS